MVVIDNGSRDATRDVLAAYPEVDVLRFDENLGFGAAINRGAERAEGEALILINDDCIIDPVFVEAIAAPLDAPRGVVMSAGVLREQADETVIDTAGMELDPTLLVFDYLNGEAVSVLEQPVPDPIGPCAAAAAFDREAFIESGGFDEALFAYWEDVDLVIRLRLAGARCVLARDARGTHRHSATLGSGSRRKNELIGFGRGYLLRKWGVMSPSRAPRVLARDGVICLGQVIVDHTATGLMGRLRGWRGGGDRRPYPADALVGHDSPGAVSTLTRRLRRRRRLRTGG